MHTLRATVLQTNDMAPVVKKLTSMMVSLFWGRLAQCLNSGDVYDFCFGSIGVNFS